MTSENVAQQANGAEQPDAPLENVLAVIEQKVEQRRVLDAELEVLFAAALKLQAKVEAAAAAIGVVLTMPAPNASLPVRTVRVAPPAPARRPKPGKPSQHSVLFDLAQAGPVNARVAAAELRRRKLTDATDTALLQSVRKTLRLDRRFRKSGEDTWEILPKFRVTKRAA